MKKQLIINLIVILIALSPIFYLLAIWQSIPENFVLKFDFNKTFEKVQNRQSLLISTLVLSVVSVLMYLLMRNLKKVDPNVKDNTPVSSFHKLGFIVTFFLVIINYYFLLSVKNEWQVNTNTAFAFFGLLIALIGNYMNNLKPNYVAGFRLPWTLKDHENWRKTHHLAGKLWFVGGIVLIIISFLVPQSWLLTTMIMLLLVLVIAPGIYSYRIYKNKIG